MQLLNLEISQETAKTLADLLSIFVGNWIYIVLFTLCLSIISVFVFLSFTELPRVFRSWSAFIDAATTNIPKLTQSINDLITNVERMNSTLTTLLNMQTKIDFIKEKVSDLEIKFMSKLISIHDEIQKKR